VRHGEGFELVIVDRGVFHVILSTVIGVSWSGYNIEVEDTRTMYGMTCGL